MTLIRLWLVSIEKKAVIYSKNFPVNECKARKCGFQPLPKLVDDSELITSLFAVLGITYSNVANDDFDDDSERDSCPILFDCTLVNQLPVVEIRLKERSLWPVVVIEQNGILFCGLSLIHSNSRELVDHPSISVSFSALNALINHFTKTSTLRSIEQFITDCMPFGTLLRICEVPKSETGKLEDNAILVRVNERISSGIKDKEMVFGTVVIQNSIKMKEKAALVMNLKNLNSLNVVLSPGCRKISESTSIEIKLNYRNPKVVNYKCDENLIIETFLIYNYTIVRTQNGRYKMNLSIDLKKFSNLKFAYFSVNFRNGFNDGSAKVLDSTTNWGQLQLERQTGLLWLIGSKLPKNGRLSLICDIVTYNDSTLFAEAVCNFKIDNFLHGFEKLSSDVLKANEHVEKSHKILVDYNFSSFNYKFIPYFE